MSTLTASWYPSRRCLCVTPACGLRRTKARGFCEALRFGLSCCLVVVDHGGCSIAPIGTQETYPAASAKASPKMSNDECLACHNDATLTKDENGKQVSLHVDDAKFKASIHSIFGCTDCHTDIKAFPHDPTPAKPVCATCHADQQTAYDHGVHAKAAAAGNTNVAKCQDCHGSVHEILPASDPKSKVARTNIPQTCGACHGQKLVMASSGVSSAPFTSYEQSVHGKAVAAGSEKAAVCTDCHGEHDILSAGDPKSPIIKFNVPTTCAKCHGNVKQEYVESIHGQAIARGNWQAPVCTDCHGIHTIKAPKDPNSSVAAAQRAEHLRRMPRQRAALQRIRNARRTVSLRIFPAITAWRRRWARARWPTAPAATACTTSCRPAIRSPPSTTPTWRRPADSAIPAPTRSSSPARCTWTAPRRPTSAARVIALHQPFLRLDDRGRDRRHGAAQPDHLPQEADAAPHRTAANPVPHDAGAARAAPDAAHQFLHPGADRLRAPVSVFVAGTDLRQRSWCAAMSTASPAWC